MVATNDAARAARVLVVEDDEDVRRIVVRALQFGAMVVAEAGTGARALESARAAPFDVILTDLGLPDMAGAQLLRELRPACPRARVVVLSGNAQGLAPDEAAALGVEAVLVKPVGVRELLRTVERLLGKDPAPTGAKA